MSNSENFFEDSDFQNALVALLCRDPKVLSECASLLTPDDFKPIGTSPFAGARWIVADRALTYYGKYHEPIRTLLKADILEYAKEISLSVRPIRECLEYIATLKKLTLVHPDAVAEKVVRYKRAKLMSRAVSELVELDASGQLTTDKWHEINQKVIMPNGDVHISDYFEELDNRIERRQHRLLQRRRPFLFIDPVDSQLPFGGIGPGHVGVVLAPLKRGKSMFLQHLSVAYSLQGLNTMLIPLEDRREDVEDRLDANIGSIPIHSLPDKPKLLEIRFQRFKRLLRSRMKVVDGTGGGMTIPKIEQIMLRARDQGFQTDALIIDYDDEIKPTRKHPERRFEFADIYRDLGHLASRHNIIVWTGAQTQRGTKKIKVLTEDYLAEDISKARKVTMAVGLGQGDWGEDSIYFWITASRIGKEHIGANIMTNKEKMTFFDRDRTRKKSIEESEKTE